MDQATSTDPADVTTHAVLAIEDALSPADRERILARFRESSLNGAAVADILDILANHDALLPQTEPFYEDGGDDEVRRINGWPLLDENYETTYESALQSSLILHSCYAVALLTHPAVPTPGPVARMAARAAEIAEERWPGGEYPT